MSLNIGAVNAPFLSILDASKPHTFIDPQKNINEGSDVSAFLTSEAYGDIMTFLLQLNRAIFPSNIQVSNSNQKRDQIWELGSPHVIFSDTVRSLRGLLEDLGQIIDEVPPDPGPRRFGNVSFRKWCDIVEQRVSDLLDRHIPSELLSFPHETGITARDEINSYFLGSFGSSQRLDYGSGHELSFLAFLGCIWKLNGFTTSIPTSGSEERGIVLGVIDPYLQLIRRLIKTYNLEPAGSHGVWGLDDHSFIPYIFGSAQNGPAISPEDQAPTEGSRDGAPDPADVAKIAAVERERSKNMYFGAISFIHDVKKGPFWEHSPMLYDISGVKAGWGKINKGMIKMYNAEVLSKFPVVQHFRFGSLFSWDQDPTAPPAPTSVHTSTEIMGGSSSTDKASARGGPPQDSTKAPWATQATASSVEKIGTAAPWASRPSPVTNTGLPPSRFPQAQLSRRGPPNADSAAADARAMPPPSKAL